MVDAFVSYAVQKLGDFLIQEVSLRRSLRQDVMWLRKELLFMQSFLKDAEQKQVEDHTVRQWVLEIKEIANDSVAILETYSLEAGEGDGDRLAKRLKAAEGDDDGLASSLKACTCICRKEIQSLKQRIKDISCKRETYGIRDINNVGEGPNNYRPNSQRFGLRRTTSYMDKQDQIFVGFEDVVDRLLAELVKEEPRRTVISIYGMGGLGKTTLAKHLYHSPSLTDIFDTRAWVCVSQQYDTMDLLKAIIKSIQGCNRETLDLLERMTIRDLEKHLRNLLKEKKYLVVVDDVWQREAWQSLERALPDSNNRSRVIITTRNADVAKRADDNGLPHNLRFLREEESWELFRRKLLDVEAMIPAMVTLAWEMVLKCRGLPLAIATLSELLSHKRRLEEWERVKEHLWRRLKDDSIAISDILSLSYKLDRIKFRNMFQHLYVLYLEFGYDRVTLPDAIGSLYSLRYLGFTGHVDIPSSIGNLKNLPTLHSPITGGGYCRLPPETANLVNLRHLEVLYTEPLQHINKLTSLQVLRRICPDQWRDVNPVDLVNLRELSMDTVEESYSLNNISSLKSLNTLELWCFGEESFPALEFLSSCQKLQKLRLVGRIEKLPPFPNSITMMILDDSQLMEDPMPILGMLSNLRDLKLVGAYEGKEITCSESSFSQLEILRLDTLPNLERWDLGTSAMPLIKGLGIYDCPELNEIPERMKGVEKLERCRYS